MGGGGRGEGSTAELPSTRCCRPALAAHLSDSVTEVFKVGQVLEEEALQQHGWTGVKVVPSASMDPPTSANEGSNSW